MKKLRINTNGLHAFFLLSFIIFQTPLNGQSGSERSSPQFMYPEFTMGKVSWKNGQTQSALLNYNTLVQKIVYLKDDKIFDMVNMEMIDTIYIGDYKFVPAGNIVYQVLFRGPVSFYVQFKGELVPPGTPAGYGGTSQVSNTKLMSSIGLSQGNYNLTLPADYTVKVDVVYLVKKDNTFSGFTNEKQLLKLFTGRETEIKQFIKLNHIKFDRQTDIILLAGHINGIRN